MSSSRRARRARRRLKRKKIARRELAKDLLHTIAGRPKKEPWTVERHFRESINWYSNLARPVEIGFVHQTPAGGEFSLKGSNT